MQEKTLKNQTAIITGADRGVGRGVAIEMAKAGANIVIACRDTQMAQIAKQEIEKQRTKVTFIQTDITKETDRINLIKKTLEHFSQIDILVNNAAIPNSKSFLETTTEEIQQVINTNLTSTILLTKEFVDYVIANEVKQSHETTHRNHTILFTSSTHSHITGLMPAYSATKAGLEMFVKELALELANKNIRVNAVAPGVVAIHGETDTTTNDVPIGKTCLPEDIGQAMVFLASDNARFITGQTLIVDGGFSLAHLQYWKKQKSHH